MTNTFKQKLLLGTALVAVGAFASSAAFAAGEFAIDTNGSNDGVYETDANNPLDLTTHTGLDIRFDDTGSIVGDNGETIGNGNATVAGLVADSGANGKTLTLSNGTANTNATVTIANGVDNGSAAGFNLTIAAIADAGGASETLTVDVNGALDLGTGTLTLTSNDNGATVNTATAKISGNVTTAAIVLDADTNNGGDAVADVVLTLDGTSAQTVSGTINGGTDGEGTLNIANAAGVTFTGIIGATGDLGLINVFSTADANSAATFKAAVDATNIVLGDGANTNTNTVTFDGTTAGFTVTGEVDGDGAGNDTAAVVVSGGKTIVFASNIGANNALDTFTVSGTGTEADMNGTLTADAITIGSGATLDAGGTVTGAVTLTGTLNVTGAANLDGDINGSAAGTGVLDIDAATSVLDNVGATKSIASVDVASGITLTVNPTGSTTFATSSGINLNDDGTDNGTNTILAFTQGAGETVTVNSAITTSLDSEGKITIADAAGTIDFNGNVGTSSKALESVAVTAGGNAAVVTASGNWYVDTTTIGNGDTLRFDGTSAQTVSGTIDGTGAGLGAIIVGNTGTNSSVTFSGKLGTTTQTLASFTVFDNSTAILNGSTNTVAGNVTVDGNLRLGQGVLFTADDIATGAAEGVLEFVVGTTTGGVDEAATLDLANIVDWNEFDGTTANSQSVLLKQGTGVILNGQDFLLIDGDGGAVLNLAVAGETVDDEYALFNFKAFDGATKVLGASDNTDVIVEATHVDTGSVTINSNNANAADGLLDVTVAEYAADNADGRNELALVYDNVTRANTNQIDERLEAIQSTVDGGNVVAATTVANITSNIIQLASTDAEGSGIAAGNISNGLRAWAQVFGQTGDQDDRDGINGYDVDTYGFAVGLDTQALADQMVVGLAFSYADTEVDSDNANRTNTEIDTYQITLYGTYNVDEATYVSGQLGYAFGDNDTHRQDIGGVNGIDANGDFDSNQFIARLEAGRAYEVGAITTLTPKLMVNYNYYDADSYRETGAGGAGLVVDQDTNHILEIGAGVDADWMFQQADGSYVKPQVRAGVRYDLADDEIEATNRLIGGGNAFKTEGFDPQQFALDLGAGVTYFSTTNWELTANYDFEYKEDYHSHAGFLRAAYKF